MKPSDVIARIQAATKAFRPDHAWIRSMSAEESQKLPTVPPRPRPLEDEAADKDNAEKKKVAKKKGRPRAAAAAAKLVSDEDRETLKQGLHQVLESVLLANIRTTRVHNAVRARVALWKPQPVDDAEITALLQEVVKVSLDVAVDAWTPVMLDRLKTKRKSAPKKRALDEGKETEEKAPKRARTKGKGKAQSQGQDQDQGQEQGKEQGQEQEQAATHESVPVLPLPPPLLPPPHPSLSLVHPPAPAPKRAPAAPLLGMTVSLPILTGPTASLSAIRVRSPEVSTPNWLVEFPEPDDPVDD